MKIHLVYARGGDWENVEAFLDQGDAQIYLAEELKEDGTSGQIKIVEWDDLP